MAVFIFNAMFIYAPFVACLVICAKTERSSRAHAVAGMLALFLGLGIVVTAAYDSGAISRNVSDPDVDYDYRVR